MHMYMANIYIYICCSCLLIHIVMVLLSRMAPTKHGFGILDQNLWLRQTSQCDDALSALSPISLCTTRDPRPAHTGLGLGSQKSPLNSILFTLSRVRNFTHSQGSFSIPRPHPTQKKKKKKTYAINAGKKKENPEMSTYPGEVQIHRFVYLRSKHTMCLSQWYVPISVFYFYFFVFSLSSQLSQSHAHCV